LIKSACSNNYSELWRNAEAAIIRAQEVLSGAEAIRLEIEKRRARCYVAKNLSHMVERQGGTRFEFIITDGIKSMTFTFDHRVFTSEAPEKRYFLDEKKDLDAFLRDADAISLLDAYINKQIGIKLGEFKHTRNR